MNILFTLFALAALVCFIIGMVNPKLIVFWTKKKGRGMACLYLAAMFVFFVLSVALVPSYSKSSVPTVNNNSISSSSKVSSSEETQSQLNEKLKSEATQADFVQLNGHESEFQNKKVFVEGTIGTVKTNGWPGGEFSLSSQESNGYGIYDILSLDVENHYNVGKDLKQNDKVKVWGTVSGVDESGLPKITATIVEKE